MSEVLVGSAYATMELRAQQFLTGASAVEQQIQRLLALSKTPITVQAQIGSGAGSGAGALAPPVSRGGGAAPGVDADAAAYTRLQRAQASLEQQQARLARQQGDTAKAAQLEAQAQERLTTELNAQNGVTVQSIAIERQLASVQQQAERAAQQEAKAQQEAMNAMRASVAPIQAVGAATQNANSYVTAFKQGLLGVVGPAAAVGLAFTTARQVVDSFKDAFVFKAQLDATNLAIRTQLGSIRDAGQAFNEANIFAVRYRLTQKDTADAIQASIPILRSSNASLTEVEGTLLRLQAKKPEKSLADAARALDELKAGQIVSIVDQFNVSRDAANKMKNEIQGGADAVQVLSDYLTKAGLGMEVLENRSKGAQGALNELEQARERRQLAQAGSAGGLGSFVIQAQIAYENSLTDVLSSNANAYAASQARLAAYNQAIKDGLGDTEARRRAQDAWALAIQGTTVAQGPATTATNQSSDAIDRYVATSHAAAVLTQQSTTAQMSYANSLEMTGVQARALALANQQKADSDKLASVDAQTHALAEKQVDDAAQAAAAAMIANGRAGQIAAIQLATSSSLIDQRAAAYYRLEAATIAANNAENAKSVAKTLTTERFAGINGPRSGGRGDSSDAAADAAASVAATKAQTAQTERQIDAQIALASAQGNTAKQIDLLRQKEKLYGKDAVDRQNIEAQIIGLQKSAGKTRVDAAQSTGLQLVQTEQNSQLAILKAQREGQERQRDQQQDYELNRSRKQEDYEEQRRKLLDSGQRKQADLLAQQFAKEQRRAAEDFNIARSRTNRNNAEATGDIGDRTDLRQSQIGDRAALRGGRPGAGTPVDLGSAPPTLTGTGGRAQTPQPILLRVQIAPTQVQIDGHTIVDLTWPEFEQRIDAELADELGTIGIILPPGGGQTAVAGPRS